MATLVLGALGTLIGGPVGGALGALAGRQIDGQIIGSGQREGPRLRELAVTSSSYGVPVARHFGRMRAAGTIIWATDLRESRETSGGGKGRPSTTQYSYTASFAVALSSRPISNIGRVWADGNLLRGASGDLKTGGSMRLYRGLGDQLPDPLIAAAQGAQCPAFRDLAYVVFEDLQLADFGNRIPALSFEIIADPAMPPLDKVLEPVLDIPRDADAIYELDGIGTPDLTQLAGFSHEGGTYADTLDQLDQLFPMSLASQDTHLRIRSRDMTDLPLPVLPPATLTVKNDEFGHSGGAEFAHAAARRTGPGMLRYYDPGRDYLPGVQRADGPAGHHLEQIEFPAAIAPDAARQLINRAALRTKQAGQRLRYQMAQLDPRTMPGSQVRLPGADGQWIVDEWEWRETGIELSLSRLAPSPTIARIGIVGLPGLASDLATSTTVLHAFELPWDGTGSSEERAIHVAMSGQAAGWRGAALYRESESGLEPLGASAKSPATIGTLAAPLPPSPALILEQQASVEINLISDDRFLQSSDEAGIANGANRMLVRGEIIQFIHAERIGPARWRLSSLLRGRGASEIAAQAGHPAGSVIVLLDSSLVAVSLSESGSDVSSSIAAIGLGDTEPVYSQIGGTGPALLPLHPVHPGHRFAEDGSLQLSWTRRARGAWKWLAERDAPVNEESEAYRVGIGAVASPSRSWDVQLPRITLVLQEISGLGGEAVWVRQIGRHGLSDPLLLLTLPDTV